jgi:hypothetical protein
VRSAREAQLTCPARLTCPQAQFGRLPAPAQILALKSKLRAAEARLEDTQEELRKTRAELEAGPPDERQQARTHPGQRGHRHPGRRALTPGSEHVRRTPGSQGSEVALRQEALGRT